MTSAMANTVAAQVLPDNAPVQHDHYRLAVAAFGSDGRPP
jgi:hypothetical protein